MVKPGKIPMIASCAVVLAILASCAANRDPAFVEYDLEPSEITADTDQLSGSLPDQEPDSPEPSEEPAGVPGVEAVGEPAEEVVGKLDLIPFFVPDPDPDDPNPTPVPVPDHDTIPIVFIGTENNAPALSRKASDPDKFSAPDQYEEDAPYFGRWIIQSSGIDVACYLGISQKVVDTEDAAAFFQFGDQYVIADHSDQDFRTLDTCRPGDLGCLETEDGIAIYVCTAVFRGHNTQDSIVDDAGNSIEYGCNTGGITCYTCNDNWQNVHIVLFSPIM